MSSVCFGGQTLEFGDRTVDVAVRYGVAFPALRSHKLFHPRLTPTFSPRLGIVSLDPEDLRHHVLLRARHAPDEWRLWLEAAGLGDVDHTRGPAFDSTLLALEAARSGLGVALGRLPLLLEDLRDGSLCAPYDTRVEPREAWHLVYPDSARLHPTIAAFRTWILEEARRTEATELTVSCPEPGRDA